MTTVGVGDIVAGTVTEITRSGVTLALDGFAGAPAGFIGSLDLSWRFGRASDDRPRVGDRVRAEVIAVDPAGPVLLSRSATENPELWAFLKGLRAGQRLSGTVAAVERFGVFVDLDDGPPHPTFPGVGFITGPELSWRVFQDPSEVVTVGRRVTCEVLQFDTTNGEARLSLRATQPDPFRPFARTAEVGQVLRGPVTELVPFGAFVCVADGVEGLIHRSDLAGSVRVGDQVVVAVKEIDRARRRVVLTHRPAEL